MTTITVLEKDGSLTGFRAKGHSGFAESGEDIVCAAVSALTQTAYLGISELTDAEVMIDQRDGELHLELKPGVSPEARNKAELILGTMLLGLRAIEENYTGYLKIIKKEVKA